MLEISNRLTTKAIRAALRELGLFNGGAVLDVPCGIGNHSFWMADENPELRITGIDVAEEHISEARRRMARYSVNGNLTFETGDMKELTCENDSFDFLWCCDGLWPGTPERGCITQKPYAILEEFLRVVKPGGTIALMYWSGHKFLPGYPFLEAELMATIPANTPMQRNSNPDWHVLRAGEWLRNIGCSDVRSRTFACDIAGPLSKEDQSGMIKMADMFWGTCESEVSPEAWGLYQEIIDSDGDTFVFGREGYAGFVIYSLFIGRVPEPDAKGLGPLSSAGV